MKRHQTITTPTEVLLQNNTASLSVDLYGGAITNFHLLANKINPLSFRFSQEQMPENNRNGAPYQGHFICLGRWGAPSEGEIKAGMPNHGQFANILWQQEESNGRGSLGMSATAPLEGMHLSRKLQLDSHSAVFAVDEQVTNINPLGRVYNMVQHPTLSPPFLDATTQIACNAATGFNQYFSSSPKTYSLEWPMGFTEDGTAINLSTSDKAHNAVFSFIVDKTSSLGWLTAYSPIHQMVFGYAWRREDYPWIHLWQHWSDKQISYRGIEFGTAGIHKPFREILTQPMVFGECTYAYIDAGETISRHYISFLSEVASDYAGVDRVEVLDGKIHIRGKLQAQDKSIDISFKDFL